MVVVDGWFFIMFLFIHLFCVGVSVCHGVYIGVNRQPGGYGAALPPRASLELSSGHLYQWKLLIGPLFIFGFVVSWFDVFGFYLVYFSLDFSVDDCT